MCHKLMRTLLLVLFLAGPVLASPYFLLDSYSEWAGALGGGGGGGGAIAALTPSEWSVYMLQWNNPDPCWHQGEMYNYGVPVEFLQAELFAIENSEPSIIPSDPGLAMIWGGQMGQLPPGNYASAWKWSYGLDPDLTNCTITLTVTPPQFGPGGQINAVSFGIQDVTGAVRSWWWACGPGQPIPWNVPTTVTINTAVVGIAAATPVATGFVNNPAFNIKQSLSFIVDENAVWVGGPLPIPAFGVVVPAGLWNYWHNIQVVPNNSANANKGNYVKYSQPPVVINPGHVPAQINGWDEVSVYTQQLPLQWPIMADDWLCQDDRPVTDFHWWGSYLGWTQPHPPAVVPQSFHIGIWTDVPAGVDKPYSHPGVLLWQHTCTNWVWNYAGVDVAPMQGFENEACFQFNQLLSEPDWFVQEPGEHIYWLSIAAIYQPGVVPQYPWGWKTRPHKFMDDAVRTTMAQPWPPVTNQTQWVAGNPVEYPAGVSWDLAFEITTNLPGYCDNPIPGDLNCDKIVNLPDFATFATHWLETAP